jgi:3-oxoacyl-[acyl-carrier protein] reductase
MMDSRPIALVTGGRRGIGRAVALRLAKDGFDVAINDITFDADAAATLADIAAAGARGHFAEADIADIANHERLLDGVEKELGPLTCLVNNAGVGAMQRGDMLAVTPGSFDRCFSINTRGTFFLTQTVARRMIERRSSTHPRSVVFVTSANTFMASEPRAEYCISKAPLPMMTKLFAVRLAEYDISTYEIRPGVIRTAMTAGVAETYQARISDGLSPIRRWGEPDDIAAAASLLARRAIPFSTGDTFHIDGGLHIQRL